RVADELVPKIHALVPGRRVRPEASGGRAPGAPRAVGSTTAASRGPVRLRGAQPRTAPVRAVVLGSSTGGPSALADLVGSLTAPPPVPIAVVQHMPAVFTRQLAERLDRL